MYHVRLTKRYKVQKLPLNKKHMTFAIYLIFVLALLFFFICLET